MIIMIRHYGAGFIDNENARLIATGKYHHIVWIL